MIAYAAGGVLETVIPQTGVFFKEQTPESLIHAIGRFEKIRGSFDSNDIRNNALRFDR